MAARETVLGVDFGTVRVGFAIGELPGGLVLPLPTLPYPGTDELLADEVAALAAQREAALVLIGNPVHMDGRESDLSVRVRTLRALVSERCQVPVEVRDERCTSAAAESALREAGIPWWQVESGRLDAMAAMALVRDALLEAHPELALAAAESEIFAGEPLEKSARRRRQEQDRRARTSSRTGKERRRRR
jgi:putative Holliday junction resolvase